MGQLQHLAIIMDGNGRWAQMRGLPRVFGHREGAKRVEEVIESAPQYGIRYLTLYAFSTENLKRPKDEVDFIFSEFKRYIIDKRDKLKKADCRIKVIGSRAGLPDELKDVINEAEEYLKDCSNLTVQIAFNYGGRQEIVDAVRSIISKGIQPDSVDEETISDELYTAGVPDPDLIIRTSGEQRISNFLLWQASYAELYFTKKFWPDFKKKDLEKAIKDYQKRRRRFGGL